MRAPRLQKEQLEASATDFVVRLAFLGLFARWSLELVRPFVPIVIWAILLAVALYPAYAWLARRLGGRRGFAAVAVTLIALATVLGPVSFLAASLAESVQWLASALSSGTLKVPAPPAGIDDWPVLGKQIDEVRTLAADNLDDAVLRYGPAVTAERRIAEVEAAISCRALRAQCDKLISLDQGTSAGRFRRHKVVRSA
jgi:predicted PurR-regulated permease PerM